MNDKINLYRNGARNRKKFISQSRLKCLSVMRGHFVRPGQRIVIVDLLFSVTSDSVHHEASYADHSHSYN
jgi:hypothetical protein